jgi:hypothetical protein
MTGEHRLPLRHTESDWLALGQREFDDHVANRLARNWLKLVAN